MARDHADRGSAGCLTATPRRPQLRTSHADSSPAHTFVQVHDSVTVIGLTGDPDPAGRASFLAELRELAEVCSGEMVADLVACTDLTATFLAELLVVQSVCARHRCTLIVRVRDSGSPTGHHGYPSGDAAVRSGQQA